MKFKASIFAAAALIAAATSSNATTLATWTFQTAAPADLSNSATGPTVAADSTVLGTASIVGVHASADTDWTTPAGNGSTESLSSNTWAVGDYYQISLDTTGISEGLFLTFDQTGSGTGPRDFTVEYSTDGTTFLAFTTYSLPSPAVGWNVTTAVASGSTTFSFDLGTTVPALLNDSSIFIRLTNNSTNSITTPGSVGTGGTGRIDNVIISTTSIPEPSAALLGAIGALGLLRRRR